MKIAYNSVYAQTATFTSPPKLIWEDPHRHPSRQRMDSTAACAMPTADESNYRYSATEFASTGDLPSVK